MFHIRNYTLLFKLFIGIQSTKLMCSCMTGVFIAKLEHDQIVTKCTI